MGEFGKPHARTGQVPPQLLKPGLYFPIMEQKLGNKKNKNKKGRESLSSRNTLPVFSLKVTGKKGREKGGETRGK